MTSSRRESSVIAVALLLLLSVAMATTPPPSNYEQHGFDLTSFCAHACRYGRGGTYASAVWTSSPAREVPSLTTFAVEVRHSPMVAVVMVTDHGSRPMWLHGGSTTTTSDNLSALQNNFLRAELTGCSYTPQFCYHMDELSCLKHRHQCR